MTRLSQEIINQIISLNFTDNPLSQREIASKLGITLRSVQYWIGKHRNSLSSSSLQPSVSRPPKPKAERREYYRQYMKSRRKDPNIRTQETESKKQSRKRINLGKVTPVIESKRQRMELDLNLACERPEFQKLRLQFDKAVSDGPIHKCYCCDRLWFKNSMYHLSKQTLLSKGATIDFLKLVFNTDDGDTGQFCKTCFDTLNSLRVPELAVSNGFKFPEIPDCLKDLTRLEERMISIRLPFMQMYAVRGCQYKLKGSVVNVPITLDTTVTQLPRHPDNCYTIPVVLKKRLTHKSNYMSEWINPEKVIQATKYLLEQELYQVFKTGLDSDWSEKYEKEYDFDKQILELDDYEDEDEDDTVREVNPSGTHTLITSDTGICLAPGENQTPISLLYDNCAEEVSFPTIYCGKVRDFKTKPTYSKIANSEIRRSDRRAARPDHLLYAYSKFNHYRLLSNMNISLRKKKLIDGYLTAENLCNEEFVNHLVNHNEGYKFLRAITNSPVHWAVEKSRVFSGIRQWGTPTLFVTMSAAETHWFELMKVLSFNIDHHILTKEEFDNPNVFTYEKKCELLQKDPVTCALYFNYRFREVMKTWKSCHGPFGTYKLKYHYHRIEFQHRGSPHVHMLLWLEDAPVYTPENAEACEKFVENLMTCSIHNEFIDYQMHHHTSTCYKKNGKYGGCRFQIPYFPMDRTRILDPLDDNDSRCKLNKEKYYSLREHLENLDWKNNSMKFNEFLSSLNLTFDEYLLIIRSGINRPTVFLKREVNEIMINNYVPKIINLMRSNMDAQFITNPHGCATYVVDYINKSQRGMSTLLKTCVENCRAKGETNLRKIMVEIGNTYLNNAEICAQEAAWTLLELPMSKLSVNDIFIPTFPPGDRARMVKQQEILKQLPKDSSDVFEWSIIDKYVQRPTSFENLCLADFATGYEIRKEGSKALKLIGSELYMHQRRIIKVLRTVNYKLNDPDNYYREQVMLYTHWRDEKEEILNKNFKDLYDENLSVIELNKKKFNNIDFDIDSLDLPSFEDDMETDRITNEKFEGDDEPLEFEDEFDKVLIERDLEEYVGKEFRSFKLTGRWDDILYCQMFRKANIRQFDLLKTVMYLQFNKLTPYNFFIMGPAGSGKSFLIKTLEQTLMRMHDKRGVDPSAVTVLKVAPTGKAAYNIKGLTLHAAFGLPMKMTKTLTPLCPSTLNEYRALYQHVDTLIIDEISMVDYNMFRYTDQRLRQMKGNNKPFGGVNLFCFGDFRQLPPVAGSPVYKIPPSQSMDSLAGNSLWEGFKLYELTEIMRQKDDLLFAQCLNNVANGCMTEKDIALIRSRVMKDSEIPSSPIHLFYSNAEVDKYNALKIASLNTEGYVVKAHDSVSGLGSKLAKKAFLQKVKRLKRTDTANLDSKITVKVNTRYMLIYNLNTADGLVNGAMGILRKIDSGRLKNSRKKAVQTLWIEFDDKEIGTQLRAEHIQYMVRHGIHPDWKWTPITRLKKVVHKTQNSPLSVCREQFPIVVSEAITIHKSQGATYNECAVHVQKSMKRSLMYVGLSRATQANGLYVVGEFIPPKPPTQDDPWAAELLRLRKFPLIPTYAFLHDRDDFAGIQFMFHNVQGLTTHYEDLIADPCFTQSDIIMLAETHTIPTDDFQIPGFEIAGAIDSNGRSRKRKNRGVMTYMKKGLIDKHKENIISDGSKVQILISYILDNVRFAVCYANPRASTEEILLKVSEIMTFDEDRKTVLVGDFNVDFNSQDGKDFIEAIRVNGLELRTNPKHYTTIGLSTIDAIFSNKSMRTGVYMTHYSYHMALYGRID